jgi:aspartate racemase
MTAPRRIGILGGMGPQATVLLMQRLIGAVPAQDDADHIPLIVDQNTAVPSRIRFLIDKQGDDPGPMLAAMAARLQAAGADALAMPCNTAHHFADAIRKAVTVPFLDMVAGTVARVQATGARRVGILGSPALKRIGLFDRAFQGSGVTLHWPGDQDAMLAAIRSIKADGVTDRVTAQVRAGSAELLQQGAALQLIACTEFSLIPRPCADGAQTIDTLDVLVDLIHDFALGGRP